MSYLIKKDEANIVFASLLEQYDIYAPHRYKARGRYSDTDIVQYEKVMALDEIEYKQKSDYPMKEVLSPIQQALFYFTEDEYRESKVLGKPLLIFARPCDINAMKVQSRIYMGNGGFTDSYFKRMEDRVKFVLMDCMGGDDTCFCVSMGTNTTDNYAIAVKFNEDGSIKVNIKDENFKEYFNSYKEIEFKPEFVKENELKVTVPVIKNRQILNKLKAHKMWDEYNKRCIGCGACTIACSTCTCFTTRDLIYGDNPEVGERRRVSSSCQVDGYSTMAGGMSFRKTYGEKMRFKMLHKFHDYNERFHEGHMCVGCGRCIHRCPELISIVGTLNKMSKAIDEINQEEVKA